jgi:hypothetical protein
MFETDKPLETILQAPRATTVPAFRSMEVWHV